MSLSSEFQSRRFRFKINVEIVVYIVDVIACSFVRSIEQYGSGGGGGGDGGNVVGYLFLHN